jgi:hypothetical protein
MIIIIIIIIQRVDTSTCTAGQEAWRQLMAQFWSQFSSTCDAVKPVSITHVYNLLDQVRRTCDSVLAARPGAHTWQSVDVLLIGLST